MGDLTRTKVRDYLATWGAYVGGFQDKLDMGALKLVTKPIKVGTLGDIELGERIIGLTGTIKIEFREVDSLSRRAFTPWSADAGVATPVSGSSAASVPLVPATFHKDLYDYALQLKLHPVDRGSAVDEDMTFLKAVPLTVTEINVDGVKDNILQVEFKFYPNRSDLNATPPLVNYGYYGVAPA